MSALGPLANQLGVNERTLRRAVNDGTLRATRPSPRKLEISLAELRFARRSWPLISVMRETLRTEPNVRFALLFGSVARGTDTPASDVDVLASLEDASLDHTVDLERKLGNLTGRRVDLVRLEDAENHPAFLAGVLADGRVLVDRDGLGSALERRRARLTRSEKATRPAQIQAALSGLDQMLEPGS